MILEDSAPGVYEAFDDGFFPAEFKSSRGDTYIAGVEATSSFRVVRITLARIPVDGGQAYKAVLNASRQLQGSVVFLDGVTYAGFDVVDPFSLNVETGKPVIAIQLYPLNLERIRRALVKHFNDWRERFKVIESYTKSLTVVDTPWRPIEIAPVGVSLEEAIRILRRTSIYSPEPEPLRIAGRVASSLTRLMHQGLIRC
ncbi:MAG: DUF99 family protein [Desulfurococcus sp.]|nr:DUF99 family protein [Desulfurococcus sp.]